MSYHKSPNKQKLIIFSRINLKSLKQTSLLFLTLVAILSFQTAYAQTQQFIIGMPFTGKWGYNASVNPPYNDSNSSHPSVHKTDVADKYSWATDLYALPNTEVKIHVNNLSPGDSLIVSNVADTSCGAGKRVRITIKNSLGKEIGWVQYEHIDTNLKSGTQIKNNSVVGITKNWRALLGKPLSCFIAKDDNSVHIHAIMHNSLGGQSCYVDHGKVGIVLKETSNIGVLGGGNTGRKQACKSVPAVSTNIANPNKVQNTNSVPLGTHPNKPIQGSSGGNLQPATPTNQVQGNGSKDNINQTNDNVATKEGILTRVVAYIKKLTSLFKNDKPAKTATNETKKPVVKEIKTESVTATAKKSEETSEVPTFDEKGCPIGDPTVQISTIQILGYYTQESFESVNEDEELLLVTTGIITNPAMTDIKIKAIGLYRPSDDNNFPPRLNLIAERMEFSNKSNIVPARSSIEFKSKNRVLWNSRYGPLTKELNPTLAYPSSATLRSQKWWEWVGVTDVPEYCQPNYVEY
jgi:hypothetical protein